ncbi:MFS transporter [Halomonas sp. PAMB 3232]|uniref:MFS transporter n=1 Tax=Halomonas sp. PAMB 3232 TaxID=3075221 RepID=UPI00289FA0AE|nr:MFS transporter [Halomonas sp. PAMB 3232]WNL38176.1 MFS transporter [Halomonas sp. PAMB 3232]
MREHCALRLTLAICLVACAVNLHAPLYERIAASSGAGVGATTIAFACYVAGVLPVLLWLNGLAQRLGYRAPLVVALLLSLAATLSMMLAPSLFTLGAARWMLGVAMGLVTSIAPVYVQWLWRGPSLSKALAYVTLSSALGFGLGAALTSAFLLYSPQALLWSSGLFLGAGTVSLLGVATLPDMSRDLDTQPASLFRLPAYPPGSLPFGVAILLAWSTVGLVIAVLPSALGTHGLDVYSGFVVLGVCSAGVLFQPWARRLAPQRAVKGGLVILPLSYVLLGWGVLSGTLWAVLLGALAASSACYGFIYLGGLSAVMARAEGQTSRASAGYFLLAYVGFALPVMIVGLLVDALGYRWAFGLYGALLFMACALTAYRVARPTIPSVE